MVFKQNAQNDLPLVIRINGALLPTSLMLETFWAAMAKSFFLAIWALATQARRPALLKHALGSIATPDATLLPVRDEVLTLAQQAKSAGRRVVLVSTADQNLVDRIARHLGFSGVHYGSSLEQNMDPNQIAMRLIEAFGSNGYDYVGHDSSDLPAWRSAKRVIAVAPDRKLWADLGKEARQVGVRWNFRSLLAEMRPHQWVKNLLLLFPVLAAHDLSLGNLVPILFAMVAFSMGASAIYILNDLLDLNADRQHVEKRNRPIASGRLPINVATLSSLGLGISALAIGAMVGWAVAGLILAYMAVSLLYSLQLKSMRWIDLFVLASLYTLRVLTGGATANTETSIWLLAFIFSVFFTLAGVKRLTGLARASNAGRLPGRGYTHKNLTGIRNIAFLGVLAAVLSFIGYTFSPVANALYGNLMFLRMAVLPIAIWLVRMVILSQRGREDYDPIIFVARDKTGHLIVASGILLALLAI